jgi:hypothetical protein
VRRLRRKRRQQLYPVVQRVAAATQPPPAASRARTIAWMRPELRMFQIALADVDSDATLPPDSSRTSARLKPSPTLFPPLLFPAVR